MFSELTHPCLNQLPDSVNRTGSNVECITEDGAYDMMGNLHEWVDDDEGTFRGGYYMDWWRNGEGCNYRTGLHSVQHYDYSTGFRCCSDLLAD